MARPIARYAVALLSAGWILSVHPVVAQDQPAPATVSDQKLDQAAAAIKQVESIRDQYDQKLSTAAPEKKEQLAEEGSAAMKKAVTDQGLSVDEYNSIVLNAKKDPALRERLVQRLGPPPTK